MKKLLIVAAIAAASIFGSLSAANAGSIKVCADININGQGTGGEQCNEVPLPAAPALP